MIELIGINKTYGSQRVVNDLSLKVEQGEIFGFLGPNGAGKTTTLMILLNLVKPSSGTIRLFGETLTPDNWKLKQRIGVMEEVQHLYGEMSAFDYLCFFAKLNQVTKPSLAAEEVLKRVKLWEARNQPLKEFSKGMQQKVGFARALVHNPELLILDEPVSSLDPYGVREVREIIREEHERGKTVVISSHILSEVEKTCTRIGVINRGRLVAEGSIANVKRVASGIRRIEVELDQVTPVIITALKGLPFVLEAEVDSQKLLLRVQSDADPRLEISQTISGHGGVVLGLKELESSLEEAFLTLTEGNLEQLVREVEK